ncbi:unnamed protein product [Paramecium primaurelia]|uniref:Uncharacterized protein n=1 Tax=Paramecium primaurelia TaxID=5886 RepID=A0A8S1LLB3_PARPR|nr:unnamed protein product [Paramecium primaurelia]
MINQNNSKTLVSVNISQTNRRVQQFVNQDLKRISRKRKNSNLKYLNATEISKTISSQESIFKEENNNDDNKTINQIIEDAYQLKRKQFNLNSSLNSSKILPNVQTQQKLQHSIQDKDYYQPQKQTSISKIHLTQNDDSILSDTSHKLKTLSIVQRNQAKIKLKKNDHSKPSPNSTFKSKLLQTQLKNQKQEQNFRFPLIWQQSSIAMPESEKVKTKVCFQKLNEQFEQLKNEKVLEPFIKNQNLKVKLMTQLIIRNDKPYFVAENKDNKNLIDNMKNENTNSYKDEYLIISSKKILEYI